ncbi:Endoplasmic reticulum protein [Nesidiocoris tenuis]|uniref:Endoplasmic reticulum protein n=1 Tax=Nesidiocoris tenuis TaxID=355587 RepID=A0ABN7B3Q6_9HEMI|nr:Endoplasmic reticulum protein [Nesidiocoris tenuis]
MEMISGLLRCTLLQFFLVGIALCNKGCVELDRLNFHKIVDKFDAVLVKFDNAYPYGPEHDAFEEVCESAAPVENLLVAEVQVKDYGEKDNQDLAQKYGARKKDFPALKLFLKGKEEPLNYETSKHGDVSPKNIKKFIKSSAGIHVSQPGCIQAFDTLVLQFIKSKDLEQRNEYLKQAEALQQDFKDQRAADIYVKLMKKIIDKGDEFVRNEMSRVENILKEKLTKEKQAEMTERINILESFRHDEL